MKNARTAVIKGSTDVKSDLRGAIERVCEKKQDISIRYSGKVVAKLTAQQPSRRIPPVRLKIEEARQNWSELMQVVAIRGACFSFKLVDEVPVFLVRDAGYQNPILLKWKEHLKEHKGSSDTAGTAETVDEAKDEIIQYIESLETALKSLTTKVSTAFASMSRRDVHATPDNGLVRRQTVADLERYEVD